MCFIAVLTQIKCGNVDILATIENKLSSLRGLTFCLIKAVYFM